MLVLQVNATGVVFVLALSFAGSVSLFLFQGATGEQERPVFLFHSFVILSEVLFHPHKSTAGTEDSRWGFPPEVDDFLVGSCTHRKGDLIYDNLLFPIGPCLVVHFLNGLFREGSAMVAVGDMAGDGERALRDTV